MIHVGASFTPLPPIAFPLHPHQGDKLIDDNEWSFLISGKTFTPVQAGENPGPDWIDARMWSEVQAVAGLPAFEGLAESFAGPLLEDFKVRGRSAWTVSLFKTLKHGNSSKVTVISSLCRGVQCRNTTPPLSSPMS